MMKRLYAGLVLWLAMGLLHTARSQAYDDGGGSDGSAAGYVNTPLGPISADLMEEADGCPYAAAAIYQRRAAAQQQFASRRTQNAKKKANRGSRNNSLAGNSKSTPDSPSLTEKKTASAAR